MSRPTPHILILLAFLLLFGLVIVPTSATTYTLTGFQEFNVLDVQKESFTNVHDLTFDKSGDDKAITLIHFKAPADHTVSYTIYYGSGSTATGTAATEVNLSLLPLQTTTSTITFNGETKSYSYVDTNPDFDYYLSGYAKDPESNVTGLIVYNAGYASFDNDLAIFKPVPNLAVNLIYRVDISSDTNFDADISYGTASQVAASVSKSILDIAYEWINYAIALSTTVLGFVLALFAWIKFLFVDNLLLIVALWISVSMAYSAMNCRGDVFKFYKSFFRFQRSLLDFIMQMWNYFIQIISAFRSIFKL